MKDKLTDASGMVQSFVLQVNFLNAAGQALGTKELAMAGYRERLTTWDFDHKFEPPAGTSAMALSYDGQMGGDRGGVVETFWHDPFQ